MVASGIDEAQKPDGRARYRATGHGEQVVVVPTRCPSGLHVLANVGYRIHEIGQTLYVCCETCVRISRADHGWSFATEGQKAASAEFDDGPYTDLLKGRVQR